MELLVDGKRELDERFNKLNEDFLKPEELMKQEFIRNKSLDIIQNKLKTIIKNISK